MRGRRFLFLASIAIVFLTPPGPAWPAGDKAGSRDSPLVKRYEGSVIVLYNHQSFTEFSLPLSRLEPVAGKKDRQNNRYHEPKNKKTLEGALTTLVYVMPEKRSSLEVMRNYEEEILKQGGKVLFQCKAEECGGDPRRSSSGSERDMSLAMYLHPKDTIKEALASPGYCAVLGIPISDQRYLIAELPNAGTHVSVLTYMQNDTYAPCKEFLGRAVAVVDVVEAKAREQKMVTIQAEEMAKAIGSTGRVALYGIYFDFNKAEVKPESDPTLEQIGKLMKDNASIKLLVVGHTDNAGSFGSNMDLSKRRATAVVDVLTGRHRVGKDRLSPVGVSFASPIASNKTEEGRAKNRRVELVEY
jgi:outer membrane protein OmpA-like peptidoglycan-associated protein